MEYEDYDICIVGGAGHVGLPLALAFAAASQRVIIYDVNTAVNRSSKYSTSASRRYVRWSDRATSGTSYISRLLPRHSFMAISHCLYDQRTDLSYEELMRKGCHEQMERIEREFKGVLDPLLTDLIAFNQVGQMFDSVRPESRRFCGSPTPESPT